MYPKCKKFDKATQQEYYEEWDKHKQKRCNCRKKDNCPLYGKCLVECIVYEATVSTTNPTNTYFGQLRLILKVATITIHCCLV